MLEKCGLQTHSPVQMTGGVKVKTSGAFPAGSNSDPSNGINYSASGSNAPDFTTGNISAGFICVFEDVGSNTGYSFTVHYDSSGWAFSPPPGFNALSDNKVKVISTGYPDSNTMTVDGGEWDTSNQSEVWSEGGSGDVFTSAYKWEYMFDGNTSTPYCPLGVGTWTPSTPLPINKSLRLWAGNAVESLTNATIKVNGIEVVSDSPNAWVDVPSVTELINIQLTTVSSSDPAIVYAVEVDGKILVDAGISDLGDSRVEYQTNGGEGSIIEVNTDDNTLLVTNSGDSDNRWIAENNAGTDFYVAPTDAVPISQDYAWGKLQIINNKAQVTGIQKDDPGYLPSAC